MVTIHSSVVYGTTDWFDGDVKVHSVTEYEECPELLFRNVGSSHNHFGNDPVMYSTENPDGDINPNTAQLVIQNNQTSLNLWGIVSSKDYLYYMDKATVGFVYRYNIATATIESVEVLKGIDDIYFWPFSISLLDEGKLIVCGQRGTDSNLMLVDFDAVTCTQLYYVDHNPGAYNGEVLTMLGVNVNGVFKTIDIYDRFDAAGAPTIAARIYNHSTDTHTDVSINPLSVATNGIWSLSYYAKAGVFGNKVILTLRTSFSDLIDGGYEASIIIFDLANETVSKVVHGGGNNWQPEFYEISPYLSLNRVYFTIFDWDDDNQYGVCYLDMSDDSLHFVKEFDSYDWELITGQDNSYLHRNGEFYDLADLDNDIFSAVYNWASDHRVRNIDDLNNRYWIWRGAIQSFVGYLLTDGSTTTIQFLSIPSSTATIVSIQGQKIVLATVTTPGGVRTRKMFVVRN